MATRNPALMRDPEAPNPSRLAENVEAGRAAKGRGPVRIGLINNRKSHRNKRSPLNAALPPEVLLAQPDSREDLEAALARFAEERIDVLAISGGDGTIRDVLTRGMNLFGDDWPAILVVPQGKTNALAVNLRLKGARKVEDWLSLARAGKTATRAPLKVDDLGGQGRTQYGFLLGAGAFNVGIEAGQVAHRWGAFQSFAVAATAIFGMVQALIGFGDSKWRRSWGIAIRNAEGEPLAHTRPDQADKRHMAGFSTLRRFPLGFQPFAQLPQHDGVDLFVLDVATRRALAQLLSAMRGNDTEKMRALGLHRETSREWTVALDNPFILDGESFPAGTYRISRGPELRFIVP